LVGGADELEAHGEDPEPHLDLRRAFAMITRPRPAVRRYESRRPWCHGSSRSILPCTHTASLGDRGVDRAVFGLLIYMAGQASRWDGGGTGPGAPAADR
jgi:hypothetical protein